MCGGRRWDTVEEQWLFEGCSCLMTNRCNMNKEDAKLTENPAVCVLFSLFQICWALGISRICKMVIIVGDLEWVNLYRWLFRESNPFQWVCAIIWKSGNERIFDGVVSHLPKWSKFYQNCSPFGSLLHEVIEKFHSWIF